MTERGRRRARERARKVVLLLQQSSPVSPRIFLLGPPSFFRSAACAGWKKRLVLLFCFSHVCPYPLQPTLPTIQAERYDEMTAEVRMIERRARRERKEESERERERKKKKKKKFQSGARSFFFFFGFLSLDRFLSLETPKDSRLPRVASLSFLLNLDKTHPSLSLSSLPPKRHAPQNPNVDDQGKPFSIPRSK